MRKRVLVSFRLRPEVCRVLLASARERDVPVRQVLEEIVVAHIEPVAATVAAEKG